MPPFKRSRRSDRIAAKAAPVKLDPIKPDPVKADSMAPPTPVAKGETEALPVAPMTQRFVAMPVDAAMDELVASLADALMTQAGDESEASWSTDDPVARVEDLLTDARFEYGDVAVDRVEADAYSAILDVAQQLSDRMRTEDDDTDDAGW